MRICYEKRNKNRKNKEHWSVYDYYKSIQGMMSEDIIMVNGINVIWDVFICWVRNVGIIITITHKTFF
jgi:hypothetical protein